MEAGCQNPSPNIRGLQGGRGKVNTEPNRLAGNASQSVYSILNKDPGLALEQLQWNKPGVQDDNTLLYLTTCG